MENITKIEVFTVHNNKYITTSTESQGNLR